MEPKHVFLLEEERQLLASPPSPGRRQLLARETRQAAVADQLRSALDILQSIPRSPPPSGAQSSSSAHRDSSDRDRDRDPDKDCDRDRDRDEPSRRDGDGDRGRDREHQDRERGEQGKGMGEDRLEKMAEQEKELGSKKPIKRIIIRPSEIFRFTFDWENTEDTDREMNAFYQSPHEARLLCGRGWERPS